MNKYETRRRNLIVLMDDHCDGRAASLATRLDRSPSYVSRMLYEDGKPGKKRIGEDMAEIIERVFGLAKGQLDKPMTDAKAPGAAPQRSEGWSELTRVDATEHRILKLFREADTRGRAEILAAIEEITSRP
jgi:hypothetical protein